MIKNNRKSKRETRVHTRHWITQSLSRKRSQEEMVGFGLIIIIIAVIILIFLRFSLTSQESNIEDFEVQNFIFGFLQHTTDCRNNQKFLNIKELIFECYNEKNCEDERSACDVLNIALSNILDKSWDVDETSQYNGYKLTVNSNQKNMINMSLGQLSGNTKGASQDFLRSGNEFQIVFNIYED